MKSDPTKDVPSKSSGSAQWTEFFDSLNSNFGIKQARQLWLSAWALRGSSNANTADLRSYMKKYGINISATNILGSIEDAADSALDGIGSFLNMGKYGIYAMGGIMIILVGGLAFQMIRNPKMASSVIQAAAI